MTPKEHEMAIADTNDIVTWGKTWYNIFGGVYKSANGSALITENEIKQALNAVSNKTSEGVIVIIDPNLRSVEKSIH